ncbi:MAG: DUF4381 domain-containing protein [Gammaproteobacteria bacterium]|nr:DUF4381 domain-containing protein [Gammaproteobacteria bacterium]MBU2007267.1 DUF4381 domain-containing protein [Gammaproteobacteria bacterium]
MNPEDLPLRDIHLPEAIGWWPPAPGWWALAFLMVAAILFLIWRWRQQQEGERALELALYELGRLQQQHGKDSNTLLRELSVLLRRTAISQYGRQQVSGFTGAAWVEFLDQKAGKPLFKGELERFLTEMPYRPETEAETSAILAAVREWIKLQRGKGHV